MTPEQQAEPLATLTMYGLSNRTLNHLEGVGFLTIGEVLGLMPRDVEHINGAGPQFLPSIRQAVAKFRLGEPEYKIVNRDDPTPDEITARAAAIRSQWTEQDYQKRAPHESRLDAFTRVIGLEEGPPGWGVPTDAKV